MLKTILQQQTQRVDFKISQSLVDRFAVLTGDVNPLHTNKGFGRRSNFRENIIHGMLPVAFIGALPCFKGSEGFLAVLKKISARFLKPAFAGDGLCIEAVVVSELPDLKQVECEYHIKNTSSNTIVTTGFFTLIKAPFAEIVQAQGQENAPASRSMLTVPLAESDRTFETIQKGDEAEFLFKIQEGHARALYMIVEDGLISEEKPSLLNWMVNPADLLATCLISTFVGMCIPGKYATFVGFQGECEQPIIWEKSYKFKGHIRFISPSTRSISGNYSIREAGVDSPVYLSGKLNTNVNKPIIQMPSIGFLKETALDLQLKDKVVLVTGGSRGIGETTAKLFALHGAKVVVNYFRGETDALRIVDEITTYGARAIAVKADVSDRAQVGAMFDAIIKAFGTIHILVNSAVSNFTSVDFLDLTWDEIQKDIDVIVQGAFHCCQAAIPHMITNKGGKIINLSTVATDMPPPLHAKYVIAKSALVGLTRSLAVEFAPHQIQVNLVVPSIVETDLTRGVPDMFLEKMKSETPMQRNASDIDVAKAVVALASSLASFTTGQKMMVTGGNAPFL